MHAKEECEHRDGCITVPASLQVFTFLQVTSVNTGDLTSVNTGDRDGLENACFIYLAVQRRYWGKVGVLRLFAAAK